MGQGAELRALTATFSLFGVACGIYGTARGADGMFVSIRVKKWSVLRSDFLQRQAELAKVAIGALPGAVRGTELS